MTETFYFDRRPGKNPKACVKKKTPPTTSNPPKTASHGNTRPRKRRTKANLKPPTSKISNTPKVQKDTRIYQDRRTYHSARATKKRARVIRLSLRGAQRRGNLVEVEHVPGNHHCYGDEIATPVSSTGSQLHEENRKALRNAPTTLQKACAWLVANHPFPAKHAAHPAQKNTVKTIGVEANVQKPTASTPTRPDEHILTRVLPDPHQTNSNHWVTRFRFDNTRVCGDAHVGDYAVTAGNIAGTPAGPAAMS